jgi:hypothetical protein
MKVIFGSALVLLTILVTTPVDARRGEFIGNTGGKGKAGARNKGSCSFVLIAQGRCRGVNRAWKRQNKK